MRAIFGWGRPLYDEELARSILQHKGVPDPSPQAIQHFAKYLRRKTIEIRIVSIIGAVLLILVLVKAVRG